MRSLLLSSLFLASTTAAAATPTSMDATITRVEGMVWDADTTQLAARHGLNVVNVTWEDTGRSKGSALGPNITDMTLGVRDSEGLLHPMPVLRFDNFNDVTANVPSDHFVLPVGNAQGRELRPITLDRLLQRTRSFLHDPSSWAGDERSLWDRRDAEVLVSAQACFLPVPRSGEATFTPVVYNYQSYPDHPAVLTIIATREGTSIQVVENDSGYMSEPLFFNADGERAPFTAVRASDHQPGLTGRPHSGPISAAGEDSMNVVLLIQVPLKQAPMTRGWGGLDLMSAGVAEDQPMMAERSDVEDAVIGHGEAEGPYTELHGLEIERDKRFPVRVTVQLYKATSNGVVSERDVAYVRARIDRIYSDASVVSSLVTDGYTGRGTEWVEAPATTDARWSAPGFGWLNSW